MGFGFLSMNREKFVNVLKFVKKCPAMYFLTEDLEVAMSFVAGMDVMQENSISKKFSEWLLTNKLNVESTCHWWRLVEMYMCHNDICDDDKIPIFFELIFDFLNES